MNNLGLGTWEGEEEDGAGPIGAFAGSRILLSLLLNLHSMRLV